MANVKNYQSIGEDFSNELQFVRVTYDFSLDAGATGSLGLFVAEDDLALIGYFAHVKTAPLSTGSATFAVGIDSDPDTIMDETAIASLTIGAMAQPIAAICPIKIASGSVVKQTIATEVVTAGKIDYVFILAKY